MNKDRERAGEGKTKCRDIFALLPFQLPVPLPCSSPWPAPSLPWLPERRGHEVSPKIAGADRRNEVSRPPSGWLGSGALLRLPRGPRRRAAAARLSCTRSSGDMCVLYIYDLSVHSYLLISLYVSIYIFLFIYFFLSIYLFITIDLYLSIYL